MTFPVLANTAAAIVEFKRDPIRVIREAGDEAVLIVSNNKPAFYAVPPELYAALLKEACNRPTIKPKAPQ